MNEIQRWFKEAEKVARTFSGLNDEYVIYKGFKIIKLGSKYIIQDVRFSNLGNPVSEEDYSKFRVLGFIKGADYINYNRDTLRVQSYKQRTEALYTKNRRLLKELPKDRKINEKRIRRNKIKIDDYINQILFYQVRIKQFNIKYN